MTEEMAVYEAGVPEMRVARAPEVVMAEAEKAANVLISVVSRKPRKVIINQEQYLEFEDWQTVAQFYGCTVRVSWTRFLDLGGVRGYEACAEVLDRTGRVISAAEAMCLNDEERWSTRPKYQTFYVLKDGSKSEEDPPKDMIVWIDNPNQAGKKMPKREKVNMGEEAVPLFQLRSMAQTRASAKALRNVFAWVVVLAGYRPTPAEEMTGNEQGGGHTTQPSRPQKKQPEAPATPPPPPSDIQPAQGNAITTLCKKAGITLSGEGEGSLSSFLAFNKIVEGKGLMDLSFEQAKQAIDALQGYISQAKGDGQAQ